MKLFPLTVCVLLGNMILQAQDSLSFTIGPPALVRVDSLERNPLLHALDGFLKDKNVDIRRSAYVDKELLARNPYPFYELVNAENSPAFKDVNFYKPRLLFVAPLTAEKFLVKMAFIGVTTDRTPILKLCYSIIAKKAGNSYQFTEALDYHTRKWLRTKVGAITYFSENPLNINKARLNSSFNDSLSRIFGIGVIPITYYKCKDPEELFRIRGCDYIANSYYDSTGGLAEQWRNTLFAGNNSELYQHELVHFYTARLGNTVNRYADEGYANYLGGSGNILLPEQIKIIKNALGTKPKDLLTLFKTDYQINGNISFMYAVSALIIQEVIQSAGFEGVKKLLLCGQQDESYFNMTDRLIGLNVQNFNQRIAALLYK